MIVQCTVPSAGGGHGQLVDGGVGIALGLQVGLGHAPPPKQYANFSEFNQQILKGNNFFLIIYIEGDGRFLYCIAVREVNSTNCLPHKCKNLYYIIL